MTIKSDPAGSDAEQLSQGTSPEVCGLLFCKVRSNRMICGGPIRLSQLRRIERGMGHGARNNTKFANELQTDIEELI